MEFSNLQAARTRMTRGGLSLLVVNGSPTNRLAFCVRAFGRTCHGLTVCRNDGSTRDMILASALLVFKREGIIIYLFHGGRIPLCACYGVFLAIVFDRIVGIYSST